MPPKQCETNTFSLKTVPNDPDPQTEQDVGPSTSVFAAAGSRAEVGQDGGSDSVLLPTPGSKGCPISWPHQR